MIDSSFYITTIYELYNTYALPSLNFFLKYVGLFLPRRIAVVCNVDLFFRDLIGLWGRKHHTSLLKEHFAVIFPFRHYNILLWNHSGFLDFIHRRHTTKFSGLKKLDEKKWGEGREELLYKYITKRGTSDIRIKLLFTSFITETDLCQDRIVSSFISHRPPKISPFFFSF